MNTNIIKRTLAGALAAAVSFAVGAAAAAAAQDHSGHTGRAGG